MPAIAEITDDLRWLSIAITQHQPGVLALPPERSCPRAIDLATAQAHLNLAIGALNRAATPPAVIDHAPLPIGARVIRELAREPA